MSPSQPSLPAHVRVHYAWDNRRMYISSVPNRALIRPSQPTYCLRNRNNTHNADARMKASPSHRQQRRRVLLPLVLLATTSVLTTHAFVPSQPPTTTRTSLHRSTLPAAARPKPLVAPLNVAPAPVEKEIPFWQLVLGDIFLLVDRTLDTVEDVGVHLRRATERDIDKRFRRDRLERKDETKKRVMILGTGWGGHAVSKVVDTGLFEVVIVSPRNFFLFTPMLAGSSVGTVDYRSIIEPIRSANPLADYYEAQALQIYPQNQTVLVRSEIPNEAGEYEEFCAPYDILVYGCGTQSGTFGTPGVREHAYFLKEVDDAIKLRRSIVDRFERANMPSVSPEEKKRILSFVVVGGGPTGVEWSGEFSDFLKRDLAKYYPRLVDLVSFKIIQGGASILPVFDAAMQAAGLEVLQSQGIEVMLNRKVMKVEEKHIELDGGELLPYGLCVWAAGTAPRDITKSLISSIPELADSTAGKRGRVAVDKWLRVKGTNGTIVALGDAVEVDDLQLPPTGQVAAQHGAFLGRLLNREYDLSTPVPTFDLDKVNPLEKVANFVRLRGRLEAQAFSFLNLGLLAYVGSANALAQVQTGNIKLGDYSSRAGNLLWRSVYLVKQVSTRNRVLVLNDWLRTRVFGRDISRF